VQPCGDARVPYAVRHPFENFDLLRICEKRIALLAIFQARGHLAQRRRWALSRALARFVSSRRSDDPFCATLFFPCDQTHIAFLSTGIVPR